MWNTHVKSLPPITLGLLLQATKSKRQLSMTAVLHSALQDLRIVIPLHNATEFFISGPVCASESLSAMAESSMFSCARLLFTYSFLKEPRTFPHRAAERPTVAPKYRVAHSN